MLSHLSPAKLFLLYHACNIAKIPKNERYVYMGAIPKHEPITFLARTYFAHSELIMQNYSQIGWKMWVKSSKFRKSGDAHKYLYISLASYPHFYSLACGLGHILIRIRAINEAMVVYSNKIPETYRNCTLYSSYFSSPQNLPDSYSDGIAKDSYKHIYVLQKLISQANRVLRFQQESSKNKISTKSKKKLRSQTHPNSLANSGLDRFLKPTKNPTSIVIEEASAQTLSLVARRQKGPIVGESYLFEENEAQMLSSAGRQTQYKHELQRMGIPVVAGIGRDGAKPRHECLVHFDLKGATPKNML
ncbi:uncharacterized protein isoform X2 [Musca autumnalis]|uniref:uncharacterized protein isoform X2 n=2 Tax=Musca autumnalis TaxID=221902 RepID=UPI003CF29DDC